MYLTEILAVCSSLMLPTLAPNILPLVLGGISYFLSEDSHRSLPKTKTINHFIKWGWLWKFNIWFGIFSYKTASYDTFYDTLYDVVTFHYLLLNSFSDKRVGVVGTSLIYSFTRRNILTRPFMFLTCLISCIETEKHTVARIFTENFLLQAVHSLYPFK